MLARQISPGSSWTQESARQLQETIDQIFGLKSGGAGENLKSLRFSLTIADPSIPDCPLIGCSTGFSTLCGYEMHEIVGRNCRFLVDPVPKEKINVNVRKVARAFSNSVRDGVEYKLPEELREHYMPQVERPSGDGVFLMQMNARKDGSLFNNMFYLRQIELNDKRYIIGLQTEVEDKHRIDIYHEACIVLDESMGDVERIFAAKFWVTSAMRRQDVRDHHDGFSGQRGGPAHGLKKPWTQAQGEELQRAVDRVFGVSGDNLKGLDFSLTLADPMLPDCPLIGCSTGFGTLCGYAMEDIVGQNCRFLVDPVPQEMVNNNVRRWSRSFCDAVRDGWDFVIPEGEKEPWMPKDRVSDDGLFCAQVNAKKDGSLFENMFYLRRVELDDRPYVIGLQTGLPTGSMMSKGAGSSRSPEPESLQAYYKACKVLDTNMADVERVLSGMFWFTGPMRRQDDHDLDDGFSDEELKQEWGGADTDSSAKDPAAVAATKADPGCFEGLAQCLPRSKAGSDSFGGRPADAQGRGMWASCCQTQVDSNKECPDTMQIVRSD